MEREVLDKVMYGTPELGWEVERVREYDSRHGRLFAVNVKRWIGGVVATTEEQCRTQDLEESCAFYNNIMEGFEEYYGHMEE